MKCSEVAEVLLKPPDAEVLLKNGDDWLPVEVCSVRRGLDWRYDPNTDCYVIAATLKG